MADLVPPPPISVDPLIAEARHRAEQRRIAATLALALVLAGIAQFALHSASEPGATRPPSNVLSPAIRPIESVGASGGVAYAFDRHGLFWLSLDGGRTWKFTLGRHVKPHGAFGASTIGGVQFVDKRHGWIGIFDGDVKTFGHDPHPWAIERTVDGGRTWRVAWLPGCGCDAGDFNFYDARHGYVLAPPHNRTGRGNARLFWTDDGGASWKLVGRPPHFGSIRFVDRRDGFLGTNAGATSCNGAPNAPCIEATVLYRTTDGGKTWFKLRVPPPSLRLELPIASFGSRVVVADPKADQPRIYTSGDGGAHWKVFVPAIPASAGFVAGSPKMWAFVTSRRLYVTQDGGKSWDTIVPHGLPQSLDKRGLLYSQLVFSSRRVGWVLVGPHGALYRTTDGGRHWAPNACARAHLVCPPAETGG
jgi:photosystem II stability/assembly factor-like uncharacterized protein